jgi:general secretion pathway protein F
METTPLLSECMAHSMHFDRSLIAFVAWGERHGVLPDALRIAADVFEDRVEQHTSLVHRLLPPIALVSIASVMFFAIVGLMVPIIELINYLSM